MVEFVAAVVVQTRRRTGRCYQWAEPPNETLLFMSAFPSPPSFPPTPSPHPAANETLLSICLSPNEKLPTHGFGPEGDTAVN